MFTTDGSVGMCSAVSTTFSDAATAERIADELVNGRLAACGQVTPITSVYRWKGEVRRETEMLLRLKTAPGRAKELVAALRKLHPYELPEIVIEPLEVTPDYAKWVAEATADG